MKINDLIGGPKERKTFDIMFLIVIRRTPNKLHPRKLTWIPQHDGFEKVARLKCDVKVQLEL